MAGLHALQALAAALAATLAWLGGQGPRAVAAVVIIAIAVPPLGELLRPYVGVWVLALLVIAFLRLDTAALLGHLRRPRLALAATLWSALVIPALVGGAGAAAGLRDGDPALYTGMVLQSASVPLMSAPALAALLGLDATLVLIVLVGSTVLVPVSAAFYVELFLGGTLSIAPAELAWKLASMLGGSAALGLLLRRLAGRERIARYRLQLDGANIIGLFVFAAALMSDVATAFIADPLGWCVLVLAAMALFCTYFGVSLGMFWRAGHEPAMAVAFLCAQRNMGIMLAAAGSLLPERVWLYFALAQLPMYFAPALLEPVIRRLRAPRSAR